MVEKNTIALIIVSSLLVLTLLVSIFMFMRKGKKDIEKEVLENQEIKDRLAKLENDNNYLAHELEIARPFSHLPDDYNQEIKNVFDLMIDLFKNGRPMQDLMIKRDNPNDLPDQSKLDKNWSLYWSDTEWALASGMMGYTVNKQGLNLRSISGTEDDHIRTFVMKIQQKENVVDIATDKYAYKDNTQHKKAFRLYYWWVARLAFYIFKTQLQSFSSIKVNYFKTALLAWIQFYYLYIAYFNTTDVIFRWTRDQPRADVSKGAEIIWNKMFFNSNFIINNKNAGKMFMKFLDNRFPYQKISTESDNDVWPDSWVNETDDDLFE